MGTKHSFVYGEKVFLFITAVDVICSFFFTQLFN